MNDKAEQKTVVTLEVAESEFERFAESWGLDTDTGSMNEETKDAFLNHKKVILKAIEDGRASVNDDGSIDYKPKFTPGANPVKFNLPGGSSYMAMDRHKDRENIHKVFSFLGDAAGEAPKIFSNFKGADVKFVMAVGLLFLGS